MNIPKINTHDFYFKTAFENSQKIVIPKNIPYDRKKELIKRKKAKVFFKSVYGQLKAIISHFPKINQLSKFYQSLIDTIIGIDNYKKRLGTINWAKYMIKKLYYKFVRKKLSLKEFYGRSKSVLEQVKADFKSLEKIRKQMLDFPSVKQVPTVLLAGFPNVGKTSLLSKLTTSKPEINSYPFTTKNINIGIMKYKNFKIQVVDTPGLLERPINQRNIIEMKAIIALKHLADLVLFVFDTSGASGFSKKEQNNLYNDIKKIFPKKKILTVTNKSELDKSKKTDFYTSCKTNEGIKELKQFLIKKLLKK